MRCSEVLTGFWTLRVLVAAALVAVIAGYGRLRQYMAFLVLRRRTGCTYPPMYPHKDPVFGFDLYRRRQRAREEGHNMSLYMTDMKRLGNTWQEITLGKRTINVMDPANYQHVHSIATQDFPRLVNRPSNNAVLGAGIYLTEGERWKHSRNLITPVFARAEGGNTALLTCHVDEFIRQLPRDGSAFDLQPMIKRLALDLSTEFLLGEPIGAQQGNPEASEFLQTFDEVLLGWNNRRQSGIMAARYMLDRKWPAAVQRLYSYLDARVNHVLAETEKDVDLTSHDAESTASDRYILLPQLAKHVRDPIALRFEVLNVFIPSRDTTSALFGNMFWALGRHPEAWKEVRRCVHALNFDDDAASMINHAALLPLRHVVLETLRAIGPSGRQFRVAQRHTVLPRGGGSDGSSPAFVPRGTIVCTVAHCVHHDQEIWGPDADEFRPSRWVEDEVSGSPSRPPWSFVPFLGGPHACPAQQQVIAQATYVLLRMAQTFERIECRDEVKEYVELQHMVIESRRGVQISLNTGE